MKSTITLDRKLIEEVMKVTPAKTKTRAVTIALAEHVRRKKVERLRSMLGKVEMDEEALEKLRNLEILTTDHHFEKVPGLKHRSYRKRT